ncbi:KinB-signaling pathway activation protein [Niallia endozanthoxylica]|uniref:KinB-signaling pathway activation protein n=1 Tax=Niallia endozanthoxylica TaxID=2036016 RepID=A0A5J5GRW1_9BACI|nr:KinB-signaling pathway activation protein [Niallia endozanthoxylica]KAA9011001.1 KinB-signaling pathway activation protein [Niallia endozanthoxylica]
MTSRNVVKLFFSTLLIGALVTGITGFIIRWDEFASYFLNFNILKIIFTFFWLCGVGLIFSLVSQVSFFAYLTVHRFGLGIFKSASLWNGVQIVFILFALYDLVYFRYKSYAEPGEGILPYLAPAVMILVVGLVVAYFKVKQTNKSAFIPAVFFMVVATILEWVPIIRLNDYNWLYLMVFPLIVCNAYQLLILHKLNEDSNKERQAKKNKPA